MEYVRRLDRSSLDPSKFDFVTLADLETCWVVAVQIPPGCEGPAPHKHDRDQLFHVLEGQMDLRMDGVEYEVTAGSTVFVAAGTPHWHRNRGDVPYVHIDVLVPPPPRGKPLTSTPITESDRGPGTAYVQPAGAPYRPSHVPGFDLATVAGPSTGSHGITINLAKVEKASPGTDWHIHRFDQLYWILEGRLTVEIADQKFDVDPGHLVVLPAGVPHRNHNGGEGVERHVAFLVPAPTEQPFDLDVSFGVPGD